MRISFLKRSWKNHLPILDCCAGKLWIDARETFTVYVTRSADLRYEISGPPTDDAARYQTVAISCRNFTYYLHLT